MHSVPSPDKSKIKLLSVLSSLSISSSLLMYSSSSVSRFSGFSNTRTRPFFEIKSIMGRWSVRRRFGTKIPVTAFVLGLTISLTKPSGKASPADTNISKQIVTNAKTESTMLRAVRIIEEL
ncbi:unnamed protein product [Pseudo-nitzschia multistriata]|uniref:Uncharacterized protein n=1 Tax=Pseudo-nitzschia multistriata TaxID=183589 RepID=A0A448ZFK6_9STRA|nr:unnamed protein product [Pseudo-nitzschia multistriata]